VCLSKKSRKKWIYCRRRCRISNNGWLIISRLRLMNFFSSMICEETLRCIILNFSSRLKIFIVEIISKLLRPFMTFLWMISIALKTRRLAKINSHKFWNYRKSDPHFYYRHNFSHYFYHFEIEQFFKIERILIFARVLY
jgi:hypothetical protein